MSEAKGAAAPEMISVNAAEYENLKASSARLQQQLQHVSQQNFEAGHTISELKFIQDQSVSRSAFLSGQVQVTVQQRDALKKELDDTKKSLAAVTAERDALKSGRA